MSDIKRLGVVERSSQLRHSSAKILSARLSKAPSVSIHKFVFCQWKQSLRPKEPVSSLQYPRILLTITPQSPILPRKRHTMVSTPNGPPFLSCLSSQRQRTERWQPQKSSRR